MSADIMAGGAGSAPAWLDVRKGRIWTGVKVPVTLSVREGALVLTVTTIRLGKKERSALVRLCGDEVLSTLIARRERPEIVVPLSGARFRYPSFPGLGRTAMTVEQEDRPTIALSFVGPGETGSAMATPFRFTARLFRAGPAARQTRDEWKTRIESAAASYRSSAVPS